MAAGLGFKTFTTGEVLTAGDVNGYLMQGINVFASSAARAAAITSPQEGQYSFLKDTNALEYYDGAAWVGAPVGDITAVTAGTGISGGGSSGDVTITNSMATAIDAKGDLIVGTGADTFDNLTVGADGTTLVADSATATGLKWVAPASGLTLINATSFSAVSSQQFNSVFSNTYENYKIVFNVYSDTNATSLRFRYNIAGTDITTGYRSALFHAGSNNTNKNLGGSTTYITLGNLRGSIVAKSGYDVTVYDPHTSGNRRGMSFTAWNAYGDPDGDGAYLGAGDELNGGADATGFTLFGSGGTISGTIKIYGLAN